MGIIRDMQRAHATQAHAQHRSQNAVVQQRAQIRRNADLAHAAAQQAADAEDRRERRRLYAEARFADVASANADLSAHLHELDTLLLSSLDVDDHIDLDRFKKPVAVPPLDPGPLGRPLPEPSWQSYAPPEPSGIGKILGGDRLHQQQVAAARRAFIQARDRWTEAESRRQRLVAARERAYAEQVRAYEARVKAYNAEVDRFAAALAQADPASVVEYFAMVLGNSVYPDDFPQHFRLAFLPKTRQLLVEYHLPPVDVIPAVQEYRYDDVRDDITAIPRGTADIRQRYTNVIAQVALRTVHEIVEADRGGLIETVLFNGIVDTVDRRTGRQARPCLVSLQAPRDTFAAIKLRRVDPVACLKHLEAGFSARPDELTGVRPVVDFDDADTEFRDEVDVLADLDNRPNLAAMSTAAYENLLGDLFSVMGLQMGPATSTEAGARWTALDPRPIFGGTVIVYAVRAGNVGAAAAHSLAGAVAAAGATKGILVTTGGFDPSAHEAVAGRPLELIDGSALLHLLAEHLQKKARIDNHTVV
jgi:restriction system protein